MKIVDVLETEDGHWQVMEMDSDNPGWALIATYDDPLDAESAASYYERWGRVPNHIPGSAS